MPILGKCPPLSDLMANKPRYRRYSLLESSERPGGQEEEEREDVYVGQRSTGEYSNLCCEQVGGPTKSQCHNHWTL